MPSAYDTDAARWWRLAATVDYGTGARFLSNLKVGYDIVILTGSYQSPDRLA